MSSYWESNTEEFKGTKKVDDFTLHVGVSHIKLGTMKRKTMKRIRDYVYIQVMGYTTQMDYEKMYAHCYV